MLASSSSEVHLRPGEVRRHGRVGLVQPGKASRGDAALGAEVFGQARGGDGDRLRRRRIDDAAGRARDELARGGDGGARGVRVAVTGSTRSALLR